MSENIDNEIEKNKGLLVESNEIIYSNFQPQRHFIILCLLSFGVYPFFGFYKSWLYLKDEKKLNLNPQFRTLLLLFYGISLFSAFNILVKEKGYTKRPLYELYFIFYIVALLSSKIELNGFTILSSLFAFVFLLPMHKMMNFYYSIACESKEIRGKFNKDEKLFLAIIWSFFLFILFFGTNN